MKKTVTTVDELPYQIRLKNEYDNLIEKMKVRKQDLADIDDKIKNKKDFLSSTALLIARRQRRNVNESIKELKTKIELHPLNTL